MNGKDKKYMKIELELAPEPKKNGSFLLAI